MRTPLALLLMSSWALAAAAAAKPPTWATVARPSAQPPAVYGGYANGCVAGAVALPEWGDGYRSIRRHRNRYYGHPDLIAFLQRYAAEAQAAGLPTLFIGDLSMPRGGKMPSGHTSHRIGLDADIWFTQPAEVTPEGDACFPSLVDERAEAMDPAVFRPEHFEMIRMAAQSPEVARVFVGWVIKQALCKAETGDRAWLGKVRPWFGHTQHFHVRLQCPAGSPRCRPQPRPVGDGCGEETYFSRRAVAARRAAAKQTPPVATMRSPAPPFPRECRAVLTAPAVP